MKKTVLYPELVKNDTRRLLVIYNDILKKSRDEPDRDFSHLEKVACILFDRMSNDSDLIFDMFRSLKRRVVQCRENKDYRGATFYRSLVRSYEKHIL